MKRSYIFALGAVALLTNACEKHEVANLPPEHATAFGEHAWSPKGGSKHGEIKHGGAKAHPAAPGSTPTATSDGAGGETPQFFPQKS
jgi:hypothetical protein